MFLSIFGVATIISNADIQKIVSLSFNKGDIWMLVCVLSWSLYSTLLKKNKFQLSQFSLIQIMVTVGLIFLVPQFLYEQSIGLEVKINKIDISNQIISILDDAKAENLKIIDLTNKSSIADSFIIATCRSTISTCSYY